LPFNFLTTGKAGDGPRGTGDMLKPAQERGAKASAKTGYVIVMPTNLR